MDIEKHIKEVAKRNIKYRETIRGFINNKKSDGCLYCDETEICCLDFHHLDKTSKERGIGDICGRRMWSIEKLEKELKKCVVVCSNCHRKIHAGKLNV